MTAPLIDATHAPALTSWVASANLQGCEFPVQNLPYGPFRRAGLPACRAVASPGASAWPSATRSWTWLRRAPPLVIGPTPALRCKRHSPRWPLATWPP